MKNLFLKGSAPYLNWLGKISKKLVNYVMLNFPFKRNYNCMKCCNRRNFIRSRVLAKRYTSRILSFPEIKEALLKIKSAFPELEVLAIAGEGEPMLAENFKKVVALANEMGITPYIFTNGSLLKREMVDFLADNNASLIISIDSLIPKKYDELVSVKGAFAELMENFPYLHERFAKNSSCIGELRVVSLAINMVLNNENYDQAYGIKEFCSNDIVFVINEPINIGLAHQHRDKFSGTTRIEFNEGVSYPLGTVAPGKECSYLRNGISIGSGGQILACAYALDTHLLFGNIRWDNPAKLREKIMIEVDNFYAKYGKVRCILRHPDYQKFIERRY